MKLKIIKEREFWWYNKHIGEEFDMTIYYYKNGSNHKIEIENIDQIEIDQNDVYAVCDGYHEVNIQDTNYKQLQRKNKIQKINEI